jgi:hypothetical protein
VACGLDAGAGGLERMSESLQLVKNFWELPEDALLRGERLAQGGSEVAAGGAGNFTALAFDMAIDGWIAVLEGVYLSTPTAGQVIARRGLPFPTNLANKSYRDIRATNTTPIGRITTINNVAAAPGGTVCASWRLPANDTRYFPIGWVFNNRAAVATEQAFIVYHATANTALGAVFVWRERLMLPGEFLQP